MNNDLSWDSVVVAIERDDSILFLWCKNLVYLIGRTNIMTMICMNLTTRAQISKTITDAIYQQSWLTRFHSDIFHSFLTFLCNSQPVLDSFCRKPWLCLQILLSQQLAYFCSFQPDICFHYFGGNSNKVPFAVL